MQNSFLQQSRFTFLENSFPKLAAYGKNAEDSLGHDNNICLLNLGRIGETIADLLCIKNRMDCHSNATNQIDCRSNAPETAQELLRLGIINEDICRKITALTEIMMDAAKNDYSSEMAANRLLTTAQELCEWFMSSYGSSRFDFMADLFKATEAIPLLADLADFGREAEENLLANTRYCLICLGDVGEEIADMLINLQGITIHEKDQMQRINLLHYRGVIDSPQKDTLHELRMVRNKAVHSRYASEDDGKKLLDSSLSLCEWLFRLEAAKGDIVRGYVSSSDEDGLHVRIGQINARVPKDEIPEGDTFREGERKIFMVMDAESEDMSLSLKEVHSDPWTEAARKYAKYRKGQDVNVVISRITNTYGALAELNDGLAARIPESEYGTRFPTYSPKQGQHIRARVKWLNPEQYPYMLLSIKEAEKPPVVVIPQPMPKKKFIALCKDGKCEDIISAIETGTDVNAKNHNGITCFMTAVMYNKNPGVLAVLVEHGADVNAKTDKGNTALMYAAMFRTAEVVKELLEYGADIEAVNEDRYNALHYAKTSRKLRGNAELLGLLGEKQLEILTAQATNDSDAGTTTAQDTPHDSDAGITTAQDTHDSDAGTTTAQDTHDSDAGTTTAQDTPHDSDADTTTAQDTTTQLQTPTPEHTTPTDGEFLDLCKNGSPSQIRNAINSGANLWARDKDNNTPLILAAEHNNAEAVRVILQNAVNDNFPNFTNNQDNNALMSASSANSADVVETLTPYTANIDFQNRKKNTALILAAEANTPDVVKVLIQNHAGLNITNNSGNTALMIAAWKNTPEVVAALLDAGADISVKNSMGRTAHDIAAKNPTFEGTSVLYRLLPEPKNALQKDILKIGRSGTPECISMAINAGVNLNVRNRNGNTPLMFAAQKNTAEAVKLIIDAGVNTDAQDILGNTALIYAVAHNIDDVVNVLLEAGADKNIMNNAGHTAADYAQKNYRLLDTDIPDRLSA